MFDRQVPSLGSYKAHSNVTVYQQGEQLTNRLHREIQLDRRKNTHQTKRTREHERPRKMHTEDICWTNRVTQDLEVRKGLEEKEDGYSGR